MARPATAVVDASVVAKWFLPEADTESAVFLRARHLSGDLRLVAPDLLVYEVANALRYHPQVGSDQLAEHMEDLFAFELGLEPTSEISMTAAVRAAFRLGLSLYDASYISLAERLDAALYTADESMLRAAGPRGHHVRSVRER